MTGKMSGALIMIGSVHILSVFVFLGFVSLYASFSNYLVCNDEDIYLNTYTLYTHTHTHTHINR